MGNDVKTASNDEQIQQLKKQIEELQEKWKRALADYQNLEKRIQAQQAKYIKLASMGLVDKLLPVVDDLERAAAHIQDGGLEMILHQIHEVFESEGVEKIKAENQPFDPELMECVDMVEGKKNAVVNVVQAGYTINDIVIRPAKVEVGKGAIKKAQQKANK